jgi:hypothetical protein
MIMRRLLPLLAAVSAWGASPWLPGAGRVTVSETYVSDSFVDYRAGAVHKQQPASYDQSTFITNLEWGLRDNLTLDVESGYTSTDFRGNGTSGAMDSQVGLRWTAKKGEHWVMTVKGAAIIAGSYELIRNGNWSAGDKSSGGLGSVMFGFNLPRGFFAFSETGYRIRRGPVPQDFFGTAGGGYYIKGFTFSSDYQTSRSINGVDLNSPGFTPLLFPATKKIFGAVDSNVAYGFRNGLSLNFTYSKILHGRNVGIKDVFAGGIGYTFPQRAPHF